MEGAAGAADAAPAGRGGAGIGLLQREDTRPSFASTLFEKSTHLQGQVVGSWMLVVAPFWLWAVIGTGIVLFGDNVYGIGQGGCRCVLANHYMASMFVPIIVFYSSLLFASAVEVNPPMGPLGLLGGVLLFYVVGAPIAAFVLYYSMYGAMFISFFLWTCRFACHDDAVLDTGAWGYELVKVYFNMLDPWSDEVSALPPWPTNSSGTSFSSQFDGQYSVAANGLLLFWGTTVICLIGFATVLSWYCTKRGIASRYRRENEALRDYFGGPAGAA